MSLNPIPHSNEKYFSKLKDIRFHYELIKDKMMDVLLSDKRRWYDPYTTAIDWITLMTPIEKNMWHAIRFYGKVPMYPQYPVANYFLDFGNPAMKIGIECDGAEFHENKERDNKRDSELEQLGWTIFRISGADCYRQNDEYDRDYSNCSGSQQYSLSKEHILNTADGLVKSIGLVYFDSTVYGNQYHEYELAAKCLFNRATTNRDYVLESGCKMIEKHEKIKAKDRAEVFGYEYRE